MKYFIIFISQFIFCSADTLWNVLHKCTINDQTCEKEMYEGVVRKIAIVGIPNTSVPILDPIRLTNVVTDLPNDVQLTLVKGVAIGARNCVYDDLFKSQQRPYYSTLNMTCTIKIEGWFRIKFPNSLMKDLGGMDMSRDVIEGKGFGAMLIENLKLTFNFPFDFESKNGLVYLKVLDTQLLHDEMEKILFTSADFKIDHPSNNVKIVEYLKQHSSLMEPAYATIDKILNFYKEFVGNYLTQIPAETFIRADLSKFL